eukprot:Nk52_evm1s2457 gene=Nk52_evmTU1s2457
MGKCFIKSTKGLKDTPEARAVELEHGRFEPDGNPGCHLTQREQDECDERATRPKCVPAGFRESAKPYYNR